jgi:hypothetical protein
MPAYTFLCSTKGGALKHIRSIGWVVATADETLWDCTGSAFGWNANLFRSEGLSHRSLFVFYRPFSLFTIALSSIALCQIWTAPLCPGDDRGSEQPLTINAFSRDWPKLSNGYPILFLAMLSMQNTM